MIGFRFKDIARYLYLLRFPLVGAVVLVLLGQWGYTDSQLIGNLFVVETALDVALAVAMIVMAAGLCVFTGLSILWLAPHRYSVPRVPLPAGRAGRWILRISLASIISLPLLTVLLRRSPYVGEEPVPALLAVMAGAAGASVVVMIVTHYGRFLQGTGRRVARRSRRLSRFVTGVFARLGPGYVEQNRIYPAHVMGLAMLVVLLVLYFGGEIFLNPARRVISFPVLAYSMFVFMLLLAAVTGLGFLFDYVRIPVVLSLIAVSILTHVFSDSDHYFMVEVDEGFEEVTMHEALEAWLARRSFEEDSRPILTVVCASGGGIQSAAWTTTVLTGLQQEIPGFARSIHLVSAVSGGSVGTIYFLEGYDPAWNAVPADSLVRQGPAGAGDAERFEAIREAGVASSLEATAWGYAFPDLQRAFLPFAVAPDRDRAWALEEAWARDVYRLREKIEIQQPGRTRLAGWADSVRAGGLPSVMINATVVESGQRLLWTPLDVATPRRRDLADTTIYRTTTPQQLYGTSAPVDLDVLTAARTSATFPYIIPIATAMNEQQEEPLGKRWHLSDGGFFDNYGVYSASEWIYRLLSDPLYADVVERVIILRIRAFPERTAEPPERAQGWINSVIGPVRAMRKVRRASQIERNELDIALLKERFPGQVESLLIEPRKGEWPLSWHLTAREIEAVRHEWKYMRDSTSVIDSLRLFLTPSSLR